MELLSPAGSVEKLYYAYLYGADSSYIGIKDFSLRLNAENFFERDFQKVKQIKEHFPQKKLYCTLNKIFANKDIESLLANIEYIKCYPIDAFIIQDLGLVPILQKHFPQCRLHLSTQASCTNKEAVKFYKSLGFSRIVLSRETSLKEIAQIKQSCPDIELEAFCHGAMCIAYSGRCLMSAYLSGRSSQLGDCAHSCRWDYNLKINAKSIAQSGALALEESQRKGEYLPIYEGADFSAVLSSKDLCMIDHLQDMKNAGIDAIKIEGRMKSIYYVALVTQAYKKALDVLSGKITQKDAAPFIAELKNVNSRPTTTGFFYSRTQANETCKGQTKSPYALVAKITKLLNKKQTQDILQKAACYEQKQNAFWQNMHPKEKQARAKDKEQHPEKYPQALKARQNAFMFSIVSLNMIKNGDTLELIFVNCLPVVLTKKDYDLISPKDGTIMPWTCDSHECIIYANLPKSPQDISGSLTQGLPDGLIRKKI